MRVHRQGATVFVAGLVVATLMASSPAAGAAPAAASSAVRTAAVPGVTVRASALATAAGRPTRTLLGSSRTTIHPGQSVVLAGQVIDSTRLSRLRSRVVVLQSRRAGVWHTVTTATLSSAGAVRMVRAPSAATAYRLVFRGAPGYAPSISPPTVVRVTPWPRTAKASIVVRAAAAQAGKRYVFGAAGPGSFDCSGLTQFVFRKVGVRLPHFADAQQRFGSRVSRAAARPGDLVVFVSGGYGYHVGIYAGGGYMYDAPQPGSTVGRHRVYSSQVVFRRLV